MSVRPALSVAEFFHEVLTAALRSQAVATSEMTEFYLVNLLSEFTHAEIDQEPLGLKLRQALAEPPDVTGRLFIAEQTGAVNIIKADGSVQAAYRVYGIPTMYVIDKEGGLRMKHVGYRPDLDTYLESVVAPLL